MADITIKYKSVWKNQTTLGSNCLKEAEITDFINRESIGIASGYRKSLVFDIYFKTLLLVSYIFLSLLLKANPGQLLFSIFLIIVSGSMLAAQLTSHRSIGESENQDFSIKGSLENKINYFKNKFQKVIFLIAMSSPLFFLSGSMYYFYFKYGTEKSFDITDYCVILLGLILSFCIALFSHLIQHMFQIKQLKSCLDELDDVKTNAFIEKKVKNRKLLILFMITGSLVLILLITFYLLSVYEVF